jgi:hypothetical protein
MFTIEVEEVGRPQLPELGGELDHDSKPFSERGKGTARDPPREALEQRAECVLRIRLPDGKEATVA